MVFGQIHLIPLVFGAGLLGITVDYAMHYCCTRFSAENSAPDTRIWAVFNGLTLGLISSVLGFVSFAFAPFPGLQQIAVFSATGLVMSYLTVLFVFPRLDRGRVMPYPPWGLRVLSWVRQRQQRGVSFRIAAPLLLAAAAVAGAGYTRLESDDSIRRLQSLPEALRVEEAILRSIAGAERLRSFFWCGAGTRKTLSSPRRHCAMSLTIWQKPGIWAVIRHCPHLCLPRPHSRKTARWCRVFCWEKPCNST